MAAIADRDRLGQLLHEAKFLSEHMTENDNRQLRSARNAEEGANSDSIERIINRVNEKFFLQKDGKSLSCIGKDGTFVVPRQATRIPETIVSLLEQDGPRIEVINAESCHVSNLPIHFLKLRVVNVARATGILGFSEPRADLLWVATAEDCMKPHMRSPIWPESSFRSTFKIVG